MTDQTVFSMQAATDAVIPNRRVIAVTNQSGVARAALAGTSSTTVVGTSRLPVNATIYGRDTVDIQGRYSGVHEVDIDTASAIVPGDALELAANGKLKKYSSGTKVAIALEAGSSSGNLFIDVVFIG